MVTQLIHIIHGFRIYEFASLLKSICHPKTNTRGAFADTHRAWRKIGVPNPKMQFPVEAEQGSERPAFLFRLSDCKKVSFSEPI